MQRKILITMNQNIFENLFKIEQIFKELKISSSTTHVEFRFLCNYELQTLTKTPVQQSDSFHRKIRQKVIDIHQSERTSNIDLYERTKENSWRTKIFKNNIIIKLEVIKTFLDTSTHFGLRLLEHFGPKNQKTKLGKV